MPTLGRTQVRDRKTGRIRRKDMEKSLEVKRALRGKVRKVKAATRLKIKRAINRVLNTGRTKFGRRSLLKAGNNKSKK